MRRVMAEAALQTFSILGPLFTSNTPSRANNWRRSGERSRFPHSQNKPRTADNRNTHATPSLGARGDACCASHGALQVPSGPSLTDSQRNTLRDICVHPHTVHRCPARSMDSGPHLPPLEGRRALHSCRLVFLSVSLVVGGIHEIQALWQRSIFVARPITSSPSIFYYTRTTIW
ncbi:hypothetical protein B0H14DRAFT_3152731, partial [Mycena olivaceomarginata]